MSVMSDTQLGNHRKDMFKSLYVRSALYCFFLFVFFVVVFSNRSGKM